MATKQEQELKAKTEQLNRVALVESTLQMQGIELTREEILKNLERLEILADRCMEGEEVDWSEFSESEKEEITAINASIDQMLVGVDDVVEFRNYTTPQLVDGNVVECYLVIIPHHLIDEKTYVIDENIREQRSLNEHNLEYILRTMYERGQFSTAEGFFDAKRDMYGVTEGSSRRASCKIAKRPFRMWVLPSRPASKEARYMSTVGNHYRHYSSYERGKEMLAWAQEYGVDDPEMIAAQFKVSKTRVSTFIGSVRDVPEHLYDFFPSVTSVGRPIVEKLVPIGRKLQNRASDNPTEIEDFLEALEQENFDDLNDTQVLDRIIEVFENRYPKNTTKASSWKNLNVGRFKQNINKSQKAIKFNCEGVSDEVIAEFEEFIKRIEAK